MKYFPESVIVTTVEGIQFKTFSNAHPDGFIIAKPKYIPTEYIFCDKFICKTIFDKQVNRLDFWIDKKELKYYVEAFKETYPKYLYESKNHKNWFFAIPESQVKQIFDPKEGLKAIMKLPKEEIDKHLDNAINLVKFLSASGVSIDNLGITFSTLVGYYDPNYSDINVVIYGKDNAWKIFEFLENATDPRLRWKTEEEWEKFRQKRNRKNFFTKEEFSKQYSKKKSEGYFNDILFVLFPVENKDELWEKIDEETYEPLGVAEVEGIVTDHYNSIVRPGYYEINDSKILSGDSKVKVDKVVSYSRDYILQASKGEKIRACGLLEEVTNNKTKKKHNRLVIGYFDSYTSDRREKEYIKNIA